MTIRHVGGGMLQHHQQPRFLTIVVLGNVSNVLACADDPEMYPLGMMAFLVWDHNSTDIGQQTSFTAPALLRHIIYYSLSPFHRPQMPLAIALYNERTSQRKLTWP